MLGKNHIGEYEVAEELNLIFCGFCGKEPQIMGVLA